MVLFFLGLLLFLCLSKDHRYWWKRKEPYLAALLVLLVTSPILIWNIQNGFAAITHNGARLHNPNHLLNLVTFSLLEFFMFSPPLFVFTILTCYFYFWYELKYQDKYSLLFVSLTFVTLTAFCSLFVRARADIDVNGHLGMIILLAHRWLALRPAPCNGRFWANLSSYLLNVLVVSYYAWLYLFPPIHGRAIPLM